MSTERNSQADSWTVSALGQDSHRFVTDAEWAMAPDRVLMLGGVALADQRPLAGNSDADVILHALTNALSGITSHNILGGRADDLCRQGITDSSVYLQQALSDLAQQHGRLLHLSVCVEAARPRLKGHIEAIRTRLAQLTGLPGPRIGITATSGEGLTAFGRGEGIQVFCQVSVQLPAR